MNRSFIWYLLSYDIKQGEVLEGIFGLTLRVPYESKYESQRCVDMCDNALMNVFVIVLITVTLP
jgi:hypothetical protein